MLKKSVLQYSFLFFFLVLLSITGCNKFRGDQEIPSYIQIDSVAVISAFGLSPTANIVEAWISVDGWKIGGYQLPLCIPVLKRGECKVLVEAGILVNKLLQLCGGAVYDENGGVKEFHTEKLKKLEQVKLLQSSNPCIPLF